MKKFCVESIWILILMMIITFSGCADWFIESEDEDDMIQYRYIHTVEELAAIDDSDEALSYHYYLMADLDLTGIDWTPIGAEGWSYDEDGNYFNYSFRGSFNGNGHTISNLTVGTSGDELLNDGDHNYLGLFGYASGATFKNLILDNVNVYGYSDIGGIVGCAVEYGDRLTYITGCSVSGSVTGYRCSGGIAGTVTGYRYNPKTAEYTYYSRIENCTNTVSVSGSYYTGGIAGSSHSIIVNCDNSGDITGGSYSGGIVGSGRKSIESCINSGTVTGSSQYTGGIVGWVTFSETIYSDTIIYTDVISEIQNCINYGEIVGSEYTGGITGTFGAGSSYSNRCSIMGCRNSGGVSGTADYTGGISGFSGSLIRNCWNSGSITSSADRTGGIAGSMRYIIETCENTGSIVGRNYVGGIAGMADYNSTVENCCSVSISSMDGNNYSGGIVGSILGYSYGEDSISNCYNTMGLVSAGSVGGIVANRGFYATVSDCFYLDGCVSSGTEAVIEGTTAMTSALLKVSDTYSDWEDFSSLWAIDDSINGGYPYLISLNDLGFYE